MSAPVYGSPPQLSDRVLEAARQQVFAQRGVQVPGAVVVFLKTAGEWHRVAIDHGTVHWRREEEEPKTWSVPEDGWEYTVGDLPAARALLGELISSVATSGEKDSASVQLLFGNGRKLVFSGEGDENAVRAV